MKQRPIGYIGHYLLLAVFLIIQLFPFYWMVTTAFKTPNEAVRTPPMWVPESFNLDSFVRLFVEREFGVYLWNSILVCGTAMLITLVMSIVAGYGFARWSFPGKSLLLGVLMLTAMLPLISVLGPTFLIIKNADLLDSKLGLILVFTSGGIPLATWLLYMFLQSIPRELEEAAAMDGSSRFRTFVQIVLPLSLPGLASTAIILFISYWGELIFPLVLSLTEQSKMLTVGLAEIPGRDLNVPYDLLGAAGAITAIPAILLVIFFQRYLVNGLVAGAVK